MTEDEAFEAIERRLLALWPTKFDPGAVPPIARRNRPFTEPMAIDGDAQPWVHFEVEFTPIGGEAGGDMGQISIGAPGDNIHRKWGLIIGRIFTAKGSGDAKSLKLGVTFGRIFQGQDFDGVTCRTASLRPSDAEAKPGNYDGRPCIIPFYFDDFA